MIDPAELLQSALARCPLVAILRGVRPDAVEAIADTIIDAGFSMIEVPLNSPDPLASIARIARRYGNEVVVGAGTVLTPDAVAAVAETGARLVVSPNTDEQVIRATVRHGMISLPGFLTPSEAFSALNAGAHGLKFFPAEGAEPAFLKALRAVFPKSVPVFVVGGVTIDNFGDWIASGANGAGLGTALFSPNSTVSEVSSHARDFVLRAQMAIAD